MVKIRLRRMGAKKNPYYRIKVREEDNIATDIGNSTVDTHAVKFIRDDKMYILRNGLLYDATGKRVNGINK